MATETLGARIADAAAGWSTTGDESGWESEAAVDAWERLLTLCDSAAAAERLAVAYCEWLDSGDGPLTADRAARAKRAGDEIDAAEADWRAIDKAKEVSGDDYGEWESVGLQADAVGNLIAASSLPLPAEFHLTQIRSSLERIQKELRGAYVRATGDNPWEGQ